MRDLNHGAAPAAATARNRLAGAASPYLLQHADNPVDWYPWGPEAFETARREDKPIFLSIGYSSCHWCHVMKRESFQDPLIAHLLNQAFVCIKVDREERPDIDGVYMAVCQIMTGAGGWPLTVVMTPDKQPFFAGTYIPKRSRFGRVGLIDLVPRISVLWQTQREKLLASATRATEALRAFAAPAVGDVLGEGILTAGYDRLSVQFDEENGGFGSAPKFPMPHNLMFLLRYWRRSGDREALRMVRETLHALSRSGIFDQVGFGFHRYATDPEWKVPHFEKMLYDQALLLIAYLEAYQATGEAAFEETARRICRYVLRDLMSPDGAFYSAEDAESNGREGGFYTWTMAELEETLDPPELQLAERAYGLSRRGNFEDPAGDETGGANILHRSKSVEALSAELDMSARELTDALERIRRKLADARRKRQRPGLDDKILTDWNGLIIAALARAGSVLGDPAYVEAAGRAHDFLMQHMWDGRVLLHRHHRGRSGIRAHADDYAFLIWGSLELYEASFEVSRLEAAKALQDAMLEHYWDDTHGGFFFTSDEADDLPVRHKEIHDGAMPSGNSAAMLNLLRLGRMTATPVYEECAEGLGRAFAATVRQSPASHAMLLNAVDFAVGPSCEVVIAQGEQPDGEQELLTSLRSVFVPNKVVLFRSRGASPPIAALAPFTGEQQALSGAATAYVCRDYTCARPTTDPAHMLALLSEAASPSR